MLRIRTIRPSLLLDKRTLSAVAGLGLFSAGIFIFGEFAASPDEAEHALEHLSRGVVIALLALAFHRLWRPHNPILRVARALFVLAGLVIGVGQLEHSIGVYLGVPPHIVGKTTLSQVAVIGLAILLAIANMVKAWRFRIQHASA